MRYAFYFFDKHTYRTKVFTRNLPLDDLFNYIDSKGQDHWIELQEDENDPNKIIVWSRDNTVLSRYNIKKV